MQKEYISYKINRKESLLWEKYSVLEVFSRVKPEKLEYYKKITCKSMATDQCNDQRVQY